MIKFYSFCYLLFSPVILFKGLSRKEGLKVFERFGLYINRKKMLRPSVWVHAVSVGELIAVIPLIQKISINGERVVVTTGTITGYEACKNHLGNTVEHAFFPIDLTIFIKKFVRQFRPKKILLSESELWPNLLFFCKKNNIRINLVNGRLSERSFGFYSKYSKIFKSLFFSVDKVICQNQLYANRFLKLGFRESAIFISGNLKIDVKPTHSFDEVLEKKLTKCFFKKKIIVLGSTHSKEDSLIIEAMQEIKNRFDDLFIVHVPRYVQNAKRIKKKYAIRGLKLVTLGHFSSDMVYDGLIVDKLGVLNYFYSKADIAFVGGSLEERGCHNVIEPAYFGVPVIVGPFIENFEYEIRLMKQSGILSIVKTAKDFSNRVSDVLEKKGQSKELEVKVEKFFQSEQGGLRKTLKILGYPV